MSETGAEDANAETNGKLVFQWPYRAEGTSHIRLRAKTARRGSSGHVSRKSRANSRRAEGETPMHHSSVPVSSRRRGRPDSFVSETTQTSPAASASAKSVHDAAIPSRA